MLRQAPPWIPELLERHVEELEALWNRRLAARRSPRWTRADLDRLDARLLANADALVLAAEEADGLLEEALAGEVAGAAAGAALVRWLGEGPGAPARAAASFAAATEAGLEAFVLVGRLAPLGPHGEWLRKAAQAAGGPGGVAALAILAAHGEAMEPRLLQAATRAKAVGIRRLAWEALDHLGAEHWLASPQAALRSLLSDAFQAAARAPEPEVRTAALEAAAFTRQAWFPAAVKEAASAKGASLQDLWLCAATGGPEAQAVVRAALDDEGLGPARYGLAGALGAAALVPLLLEVMMGDLLEDAEVAAVAFHAITGCALGRGPPRPIPRQDDEEGFEEVVFPDVSAASVFWKRQGAKLDGAARLVRGRPASAWTEAEAAGLDLRAGVEHDLRAVLAKRPSGGALGRERLGGAKA